MTSTGESSFDDTGPAAPVAVSRIPVVAGFTPALQPVAAVRAAIPALRRAGESALDRCAIRVAAVAAGRFAVVAGFVLGANPIAADVAGGDHTLAGQIAGIGAVAGAADDAVDDAAVAAGAGVADAGGRATRAKARG